MDILPFIIFVHIHQTLRDHDRDPVFGIAESFDQHIYHIKALAEYLMAECKLGCDFSHDFHLIVFNNLICHDCSSPSSFLYFVYFISIPFLPYLEPHFEKNFFIPCNLKKM